jgi:hypothetical protein
MIHSPSEFLDGFIEGAARAFFVMAYASYVEEGSSTDNDLGASEREYRSGLPSLRDVQTERGTCGRRAVDPRRFAARVYRRRQACA